MNIKQGDIAEASIKRNRVRLRIIILVLVLLLSYESSAAVFGTVTNFVCDLKRVIAAIGGSLVAVMMIYAGVKYVYAADDPGGRKQAQSMFINAMIGALFLVIADAVIGSVAIGTATGAPC